MDEYLKESLRLLEVLNVMPDAGVLQAAALGMADLQMGEIRDESAEADIETIRNGTTYSHPVLFVRDMDGVWRIKSF